MVLTAYSALFPVRLGLVVTVAGRSSSAGLAPATWAPEPHAFAARVMSHVLRHTASIASRFQRLVTIGRTPLFIEAGRTDQIIDLRKTEEEYFS
jgi:hypothetical protein